MGIGGRAMPGGGDQVAGEGRRGEEMGRRNKVSVAYL